MAKDADQIVVGANGEIYTAPTGATLPTDESSALNDAFDELGFTSEDGVTVSDGKTIERIGVWQSFYPQRTIVTEREFTVSFVLRQWSKDTVELAFGGTVTDEGGGTFKLAPPEPEDLDQRAVVIDWRDGDKDYRLVIPKATVTETVETNVTRTAAADLPVTLAVEGVEGQDPWFLYTNDSSFSS